MRGVLLEGEGVNEPGGSVRTGRGGGTSAVATSLGDAPGGGVRAINR